MQDPNHVQQMNTNPQAVPTFFIPNVPQSVTTIQPTQQILLNQQNNFLQSVRMPISSVNQWTVNNVLTSTNVNQVHSIQGPRILFSQSPNNEQFIMQNRTDINNASQTVGVNQRFIPAHSLVVAQPLSNQIKQFAVSSSPIQIPIQQQPQQPSVPQLHKLAPQVKLDIQPNISNEPSFIGQIPNSEKPSLISDISNLPTSIIPTHIDQKLQNSNSCIDSRRILELAQGIDPLLQLDEDVQDMFNLFLEEFLIHVTERSFEISKLRNSSTLETKDFQYIFERDWDIFVPGYQNSGEKPKKINETEVHRLRMALIKKQCKK